MIFCSVELFFRIIVGNYEKRENPISEQKYCRNNTKFLHNVRASEKLKLAPKNINFEKKLTFFGEKKQICKWRQSTWDITSEIKKRLCQVNFY